MLVETLNPAQSNPIAHCIRSSVFEVSCKSCRPKAQFTLSLLCALLKQKQVKLSTGSLFDFTVDSGQSLQSTYKRCACQYVCLSFPLFACHNALIIGYVVGCNTVVKMTSKVNEKTEILTLCSPLQQYCAEFRGNWSQGVCSRNR